MKLAISYRTRDSVPLRYCLALMVLLSGCSVKMVADYNAAGAQEIIRIAKVVDLFYGDLLETRYEERSYDRFAEKYRSVEVDLRGLMFQNRIRPYNRESTRISEIILDKWIKYKNRHKSQWEKYRLPEDSPDKIKASEIYKDVLVEKHRRRFQRLFIAIAIAEEAKKLAASDVNEGDQE